MKISLPPKLLNWAGLLALLVAVGAAWIYHDRWWPAVQSWASNRVNAIAKEKQAGMPAGHDHGHGGGEEDAHAGHDHAGHDEGTSLELSAQARRNIGLADDKIQPIRLEEFTRAIDVPAMVVERPGRTKIKVAAPMTGVVTDVHVIRGEAVTPGSLMFNLRLTHEDLVQAQTDFLRTLGELDVEEKEIARLQKFTSVIEGKRMLEREYAKQKLEAVLSAYHEALLLHGLTEEQVDKIVETRRLISEIRVFSPVLRGGGGDVLLPGSTVPLVALADDSTLPILAEQPYVVQSLELSKGQFVQAGDTLCVLADFRELYIRGQAFEHDADEIAAAANGDWDVSAVLEDNQKHPQMLTGLQIVYLENEVDPDSRALHFYVRLTNQVTRDVKQPDGKRFLTWQYKPGQRMQLRIPVERWSNRIVLPVDAVAIEGAEYFVFQQNGDHFDRRPVHVEYRDQYSVVIANDGSLFPGDTVARTGAHQMQMALKNKAGGGVDPHAGHHH